MQHGNVLLYPGHRTLIVDGRWEHLTPMMSKLLAYLMARPGQLISLRTLMRQVWDTEYVGDMRTIHVHVSWLRKALGKERRSLIQTVRHVGYRFGEVEEGDG
jgi:DNA-binding response OmpR family regulator